MALIDNRVRMPYSYDPKLVIPDFKSCEVPMSFKDAFDNALWFLCYSVHSLDERDFLRLSLQSKYDDLCDVYRKLF